MSRTTNKVQFRTKHNGVVPLVELHFGRRFDETASQHFAPFKLPELGAVILENVTSKQIAQLTLDAKASLVAGIHEIPVGDGPGFKIEIPDKTEAQVNIEVGPPREGSWAVGPLVHKIELELTNHLRLLNVVETLVELRSIIEPEVVTSIREFAEGPVGKLVNKIGGATLDAVGLHALTLGKGDDSSRFLATWLASQVLGAGRRVATRSRLEQSEILVKKAVAKPKWLPEQGRWELTFSFYGILNLGNRVEYPFADVVLPQAILPTLHASLEQLFTFSPLAGSKLVKGKTNPLGIINALHRMVNEVNGNCNGVFSLPELAGRVGLVDRTQLRASLSTPEKVMLSASFKAKRKRNLWRFDLPQIAILPALGTKGIVAKSSGSGRFDLTTPKKDWWERFEGDFDVLLKKGSTWPAINIQANSSHVLTDVKRGFLVTLKDFSCHGALTIHSSKTGFATIYPAKGGVSFSSNIHLGKQALVKGSGNNVIASIPNGSLKGKVTYDDQIWDLAVSGCGSMSAELDADINPIPELQLNDNLLKGLVDADTCFDLGVKLGPTEPGGELVLKPRGDASFTVNSASINLEHRIIDLPAGSIAKISWKEGAIQPEGVSSFAFDLAWDLFGKDVMIQSPTGSVSLLVSDLRQGELTVSISPGGRFSVLGGKDSTYGARFFNALLDPAGDPAPLLDLLESEDGLEHIEAVIRMFNEELAHDLARLRRRVLHIKNYLKEQNIKTPGDILPRKRLAALLSQILVENDSMTDKLVPLIKDVTEARGLNVAKARMAILEAMPDTEYDYEIGGLLRWLATVTAPGIPVEQQPPVEVPPLRHRPEFQHLLEGLLSANEIYEMAKKDVIPSKQQMALLQVAPELAIAQLDYVLKHCRLSDSVSARLRFIRDSKKSVSKLEHGWGGLAFAGQQAWIAGFLGEVIGPLPGIDSADAAWPAPCALGVVDVAILLQACLSESHHGLQSQINNRMLLELLRSRPKEFTRDVLIEVGHQAPRVLAGVLMAFLGQDQHLMKEEVDLVKFLEEKLELPVPNLTDFMAGGKRVRDSYYKELLKLAEAIFECEGPYQAKRSHLRNVDHKAPRGAQKTADDADVIKAIEAADKLGHALGPKATKAAKNQVIKAYKQAFLACSDYLKAHPKGFQRDWFKSFWMRNEEALKVLSVVRAWQEDQDDVRTWLRLASGATSEPKDEKSLVEAVIDTMYFDQSSKDLLLADPLVNLLIDPEPGHYDLTIIGAMGVVTWGSEGREFEHTYERLEQRRGVKIIRANTGLFQPFEHNAAIIIRALDGVTGPWAWVGYSQGCANLLQAESFLKGGTPDQNELLSRLVCRNFVYSAANGSAHGTSGTYKFIKAITAGERFLKHYQSRYSRELIDLFLRLFRVILDSKVFVSYLGGAHSLTPSRADLLHRDGQFADWVPTSTTRGVVRPDRIPEALEAMYWVHRHLIGSDRTDTQVQECDTVGHSTRINNERSRVLARCDMGSLVQTSHHWAPLTFEAEQITTERDLELGVYMEPKDRHITPWLDVNARFGRIAIINK